MNGTPPRVAAIECRRVPYGNRGRLRTRSLEFDPAAPVGGPQGQPTKARALRNMRSQGESGVACAEVHAFGAQL